MSGQTIIELAAVISALHETASQKEQELEGLRRLAHDLQHRNVELQQLLQEKEVPLERTTVDHSSSNGRDGESPTRGQPKPYHLTEEES